MLGAQKKGLFLLIVTLLFVGVTVYAVTTTTPEGPTSITNLTTSRKTANKNMTINVQGGNVSQMVIVGKSLTQSWAGFYGNISGRISLESSTGSIFYDWTLADPKGEIYATMGTSVDWSQGNVKCWNVTIGNTDPLNYANFTSIEEYQALLGQKRDDADRVNATFRYNESHKSFYIGSYFVEGVAGTDSQDLQTACPSMNLFNGTQTYDDNIYEQVLLRQEGLEDIDSEGQIIYAALLEAGNQNTGFNGEIMDFQMLLGEDAHNGNLSDSIYYFYVELE